MKYAVSIKHGRVVVSHDDETTGIDVDMSADTAEWMARELLECARQIREAADRAKVPTAAEIEA